MMLKSKSLKNQFKFSIKISFFLLISNFMILLKFSDGADFIYDFDGENDADDLFVFSANELPDDPKSLPVLANGHIGFVLFSDSIFMNGLYNGADGLSHRARIQNYANMYINEDFYIEFSLNVKNGYFKLTHTTDNDDFIITHYIYAHRFYNRAIINQIFIQRLNYEGDITVQFVQDLGTKTNDISFPKGTQTNTTKITTTTTNQITTTQYKTYQKCGKTKIFENKNLQKSLQDICILWTDVPSELTLDANEDSISYKFVMTIDGQSNNARQEMIDVLKMTDQDLMLKHISAWNDFWNTFDITIDGDDELEKTIRSSIYSIVNSLSSPETNLPKEDYYGLTPVGLGRGGANLEDYEGHSFWDTEIWMFPVILLMNSRWANELLHYRYLKLGAAELFAQDNGDTGARFPWESALTGWDVTQPDYGIISDYQIHITADISYAMRLYLSMTNDIDWLQQEGCRMGMEIAEFWANRVTFNQKTGYYDIRGVMGPDEYHYNVTNNMYTNIVAGYALYFGEFLSCWCNGTTQGWNDIASKIAFLYDSKRNYHPQYQGYVIGTNIKQADTIMMGYPLNIPMQTQTKLNDLNIYAKVTTTDGPAMAWSMFAINYHDINQTSQSLKYLKKTYTSFVHDPFYVWNEYDDPTAWGASNFITGAGGFLQMILNGYGGIRIFVDRLEFRNPILPTQYNQLKISGIEYLGIQFNLIVQNKKCLIQVTKVDNSRPLQIVNGNTKKTIAVSQYSCQPKTVIKPITYLYEECPPPVDVFGK